MSSTDHSHLEPSKKGTSSSSQPNALTGPIGLDLKSQSTIMSSTLSEGQSSIEVDPGLNFPRVVRDNRRCLPCRRLGRQCDGMLPECSSCLEDEIHCTVPISAEAPPRAWRQVRKRRRISPEPEGLPRPGAQPGSRAGPDSVAEPEAETEILVLRPSVGYQAVSLEQQQQQQQQQQDEEDDETFAEPEPEAEIEILASTTNDPEPGPSEPQQSDENHENDENFEPRLEGWRSSFMALIEHQLRQHQRKRLRETPGYLPPPSSAPTPDPDHDYAIYYDYQYDNGFDDFATGETARKRRKNHTPYTLDLNSRTSTVYEVKNTWTGEGNPPLKSMLNDFIDYMKECHISHAPASALPLGLLPSSEPTTAETLRYYTLRPNNHGTEPLEDINPTNEKLLRLVYSNPLVLQLIIAQRANHRDVSSATLPTGQHAESLYRSITMSFESRIERYIVGHEEEMLPLTLGALILCLVERARLDKRGQAHNYPTAATAIIKIINNDTHANICSNLPNILIEYYMHISMFACLAADVAESNGIPFVSEAFASAADNLIAENYKGKLCGNWLPVMSWVHDTFSLGIAMGVCKQNPSGASRPGPSDSYMPDHRIEFERIHSLLTHVDLRSAGINLVAASLWRNAALLYLRSLLDWPHAPAVDGPYAKSIEIDYSNALMMLTIISELDSINQALCWPLVVIGCFAKEKVHQGLIACRLKDTASRFKVGNALESYHVLLDVWSQPPERRSPWLLHRSMRSLNVWGNNAATQLL